LNKKTNKHFDLHSSNLTSGMKKQHSYVQHHMTSQDYPNTCYQLNGSNNNNNNNNQHHHSNSTNYPPPPSYGAPHGTGGHNPAFQTTFGYSRSNSPLGYPHSNV